MADQEKEEKSEGGIIIPEEAKEPEEKFVFSTKDYMNEKGEHVQERVLISGTLPAGFPKYVGSGKRKIGTPGGVAEISLGFDIEGAKTLGEAFKLYSENFERTFERFISEQERKALMAGPMLPPGLEGLNGPPGGRPGLGLLR